MFNPSACASFVLISALALTSASPINVNANTNSKRWAYQKYFDLQGHRGGRGEAVENTLPAFAWGLLAGVTTLEMDGEQAVIPRLVSS